jgi:hypothetical protein
MASSSVAYCNGQPKRIVADRTVCQATCYPTHGGHGAASSRNRWQRRRRGATSTKQWLLILSIQKLATYARTVVCHSAYDYWPADRVHRALRAPRAFTFHSGAAAARRPAYAVLPVCMVYACMALRCTAQVLPNLVVCAPWQHMVCAMRGIGRRALYGVCCLHGSAHGRSPPVAAGLAAA